jgi:K+-sensing histidine kinase KdpD
VRTLVTTIGIANSVIFVALAALALRRFRARRDIATGWLSLAFAALGLIVTFGRLVPARPHGLPALAGQRLDIELLVLFPYLLYRFATAFVPPSRRLQAVVSSLTAVLSVWTFALPHVPASGEHRSAAFQAYVVAFVVHWTVLSVAVTVRLWSAGRQQPSVSANRMRLLSFASAALTLAIVGLAFRSGGHSAAAAAVQLLGLLAAGAFLLGIEPPAILRVQWRAREYERLQEAVRNLMTLATTRREIAERVVGPAAAVVGARAAALFDGDGEPLYAVGEPSGPVEVRVEQPGAILVAWTSPYAPFFGEDELRLLETITSLTGIALDRVRLFEQEHASRIALEHANEVMTNFVSLAAHELRTPVTTVHGFVQTLNHLSGRLGEEQKQELREALEQQTARMASLVEQLLDLSRLDADAIEVRPQQLDLATHLRKVVATAAGGLAGEIEVVVDADDEVMVDPEVLDHIVTNLVTNALRYGRAPVRVTAAGDRGNVRLSVEDAGPGVAEEIEETLFERFTRAGVARDPMPGTGLGLAIARAYARAHRGDLVYERAEPTGARFVVELPSV